jgi:hypothetical protein
MRHGMPRPLLWAANIALLLGTLVLLVLALEIFLRVSGIQKVTRFNPPIYRASEDPRISYELIPSHRAKGFGEIVTTNSLGFRSPEVPAGARPIVLLGDSLVFGYGVRDDQTVGHSLQPLLGTGHLLSAGVGGYNIAQERAVFERHVRPLNPRALILVFMWNDFDEAFKLDRDGYLRPLSDTGALTYAQSVARNVNKAGMLHIPFKGFLQANSAVFGFLERTTKSLPFRARSAGENIFADTVTDAQLAAYEKEFRALSGAAGNIPKMFVIWPETPLHLASRRTLTALAETEGFFVVDLYEIFGNTYDTLGWDGHPNAATSKRTAEALREAMRVAPGFSAL